MNALKCFRSAQLDDLRPSAAILINPVDDRRLGLHEGQEVKIVSATNLTGEYDIANGNGNRQTMVSQVKPTQTLRPDVISFALDFGHFATGSNDVTIDGVVIKVRRERRPLPARRRAAAPLRRRRRHHHHGLRRHLPHPARQTL